MKTKKLKIEKKDKPMFAFLPEMILNHLNEAKPTEPITTITTDPVIEKITITADPEIPNLDPVFENFEIPIIETTAKIETEEAIKTIETVDKTDLETQITETQENIITRFLKKIKH